MDQVHTFFEVVQTRIRLYGKIDISYCDDQADPGAVGRRNPQFIFKALELLLLAVRLIDSYYKEEK